jgi:hypothetical protein
VCSALRRNASKGVYQRDEGENGRPFRLLASLTGYIYAFDAKKKQKQGNSKQLAGNRRLWRDIEGIWIQNRDRRCHGLFSRGLRRA